MLITPILLITFNRPILTKKVFEKIREAKPCKLYIAIDGPRENNKFDHKKIYQVNKIFENIDWDCKVFFLKRDVNLGCKIAVSGAIDWFFNNENKGIILEDDCLPNSDFFIYCQQLLSHYEDNNEIQMITGDNFQDGLVRGDGSYYFSKLTHVWGWATWKRAWNNYDINMSFWPNFRNSEEFKKIFNSNSAQRYFKKIFDEVYNNKIDTWDYQWTASMWYNKGLCISPKNNLVKNIGFGPDATHTKILTSRIQSQIDEKILPLIHPSSIKRNYEADEYIFLNVFGGSQMSLVKRILRKLKTLFF
jgi:hypothetical protein